MSAQDLRSGPAAQFIRAERLIVVLRRVEPQTALLELVDELAEAGVRIFEVTFDAPSAADDVVALRQRLGHDALVGAGTLLSIEQLGGAIDAGADFGVSPLHNFALVEAAIGAGLPFVPGAFTPTEMRSAWSAGATFVKLFPASAVGPQFVRELRGPLPEIELIPTGGVDANNAVAYLEAGAAAVGIGGALVRAKKKDRRALVAAVRRS
jgi:2-dehydro-3-deoxyphosphogluconate aldolase / (4S)-4-hydroxy-2-oxoglutarate aldolase